MRMTLTATALFAAALVAPIAATPASAQGVGVYMGEDGVGVRMRGERWRDRDYDDRRVVVRERGPDVVYRRGGGDCRVIVERRINRWGERVVRRTRVCD